MWPSARPFALSPTVFTFASKPTASTIYILAAGRVAVCQDLRARRRGQPNRIHLPMTLSKKVRCASAQGGRLPRLRWQGAAATPLSSAPRLPASQPTITRRLSAAFQYSQFPPFPISLSVSICAHLWLTASCPPRSSAPSNRPRERASVLECGGPPPLFPSGPINCPRTTAHCQLLPHFHFFCRG